MGILNIYHIYKTILKDKRFLSNKELGFQLIKILFYIFFGQSNFIKKTFFLSFYAIIKLIHA